MVEFESKGAVPGGIDSGESLRVSYVYPLWGLANDEECCLPVLIVELRCLMN